MTLDDLAALVDQLNRVAADMLGDIRWSTDDAKTIAKAASALESLAAENAQLDEELEKVSENRQENLRNLRKCEAERDALRQDAEYYKWRLREIIPLFEEARDALPAITLVSAKLRNIDLSLGERMDRVGTRKKTDFDATIASGKASPTK